MTIPVPSSSPSISHAPSQGLDQQNTPASRCIAAHPETPRYSLLAHQIISGSTNGTALFDHTQDNGLGQPRMIAGFFSEEAAERCLAALEQHPVLCRLVKQLADAVNNSADSIYHGELGGVDNPPASAIAEYCRLCDLVTQADEVLARTRKPTPTQLRHQAMLKRLSAGKVAKRPQDMSHSRPTGHNEFEVATSPATVPAAEDLIDSRDTPPTPPTPLASLRRDSAEAAVAIVGQGPYATVVTPSSLGHPAAPAHEPHAIEACGGLPASDPNGQDHHEDDGN